MRVEWTKGAERNLDAIEQYIAQDNPVAAAKTVLKIVRRTFAQLSKQPSSGKPGRINGTRELIFPEFPYIVIYSLQQETLFILQVFHTAQDIQSLSMHSRWIMETRVQKWGLSLALRIPGAFAKKAKIQPGSRVDLIEIKGKLVITPIETEEPSLKMLLAGITAGNCHHEVVNGVAVGNEVW